MEINVSDSDSDSTGSYDLYYKKSGINWTSVQPSGSVNDGGNYTAFTWDTANLEGDYTLNITEASNYSVSATRSFTVDNTDPTISLSSPSERTNSDSPDVTVTGSDNNGVKNVSFTVDDSNNNEEGSKNCSSSSSCTLSLSDLSDGTYSVDATVFDNAGNKQTKNNMEFTVDTSYDGDTTPTWPADDGEYFLLEDDDEKVLTWELDEDSESSDITLTCYDGGDDEIDSDTNSVTSDNTEFDCEFDGDDYSNSEVDVYVEMCDEAGNCEESSTRTYIFDGSRPLVTDVETAQSVVNSDFDVDFTATDVSDITDMEYFFDDDSVDYGDGTSSDVSDGDNTLSVSVSELSEGEHTLYLRVKDGAGRWSTLKSLDFEYLPDAVPKAELTVPESVEVTAGNSSEVTVTIENTGKLLVSESTVTLSGPGASGSDSITDFEPGQSFDLTFTVTPPETAIGEKQLTVSVDNPSLQKKINFRVKANEQQQTEVESQLSTYEGRLRSLSGNVSALKSAGLNDKLSSRLDSNFSEFQSKVESAKSAAESGKYYEAQTVLNNIDTSYTQATESFEAVRQKHNKNQQQKILLALFGVIVVAGLGAGAYVHQSDEYDVNLDKLNEVGVDTSALDGIVEKVKSIFDSDHEEAEEFEWNGFR